MKNPNTNFILTFEWHSLCRDLLQHLWLILLTGLTAFMGVYIAGQYIQPPSYTSSATLAVRSKSGTSSAYSGLSVSADMAKIYARVFMEPSLKTLAAENLGLEVFDGELLASAVEGINVLTLSVTADDPELAWNLLSSVLEVYPAISETVFSNAVIDVILTPRMPLSPSSQSSARYYILLSLAFMLLQTALIVLLSLLRETVKHEKAFQKMIDLPLLGTVVHEKPHLSFRNRLRRKKCGLLIDSAFASLKFSEDYQKIATRLEYLHKNQNASLFAVTSIAENEGKSTAAANLALALADRGYQVLLIDLDFRKPSLHKLLGYQEGSGEDFADVLSGKISSGNYHFLQYKNSSLFLALSSKHHKNISRLLDSELTGSYLRDIRSKADFILIDTPPTSVSADAARLVRLADQSLLVVRTDRAAAADINDTLVTLTNVGGTLAGCILNDVYSPFTFFGQMGSDESSSWHDLYGTGKRYSRMDRSDYALLEKLNQKNKMDRTRS